MSDIGLVRRWVEETGATGVIQDTDQAVKIGLSLLRSWRYYQITGRYRWSGDELYDYTCFLHAFANQHAAKNDTLYKWLTDGGLQLLDCFVFESS